MSDPAGLTPSADGDPAQKFNPNHDELGRFTTADGAASGRVQLAQADGQRKYSVNLAEEEVDGGHTLRDHVRKTDEYLLGEVNRVRLSTPDADYGYKQKGSFLSEEAANDFVNRVLENNKQLVDKVASGEFDGATLNQRFGYVTGKEAIKEFGESLAYVRPTYDVRVRIRHDTRSPRGYRVFTAFPRNRISGE